MSKVKAECTSSTENLLKDELFHHKMDAYEELVGPEIRGIYDLTKFSVSQFFKAIEPCCEDKKIEQIIVFLGDEEAVVEQLVKTYPKLEKQ